MRSISYREKYVEKSIIRVTNRFIAFKNWWHKFGLWNVASKRIYGSNY